MLSVHHSHYHHHADHLILLRYLITSLLLLHNSSIIITLVFDTLVDTLVLILPSLRIGDHLPILYHSFVLTRSLFLRCGRRNHLNTRSLSSLPDVFFFLTHAYFRLFYAYIYSVGTSIRHEHRLDRFSVIASSPLMVNILIDGNTL